MSKKKEEKTNEEAGFIESGAVVHEGDMTFKTNKKDLLNSISDISEVSTRCNHGQDRKKSKFSKYFT